MYQGEIKSHIVKNKKKVNVKSLLLWYVGIAISFLPIFVDILVFLGENDKITKKYWIEVCLKGDVLWILATIIVLTVIDYFSGDGRKKGLKKGCALFGVVMWAVAVASWIVFKYIYEVDYEKDVPIVTTLIVAGITMTCCTPLQIKTMEVKE